MKRRTFLKRARQLTGLGLLAGVYTRQVEPFWQLRFNVRPEVTVFELARAV